MKLFSRIYALPVRACLSHTRRRLKRLAPALRDFIEAFAAILVKLILAAFAGWLSSLWLIPLAEAERGYSGGVGGEYIVMTGIGGLVLIAAARWLDIKFMRKER